MINFENVEIKSRCEKFGNSEFENNKKNKQITEWELETEHSVRKRKREFEMKNEQNYLRGTNGRNRKSQKAKLKRKELIELELYEFEFRTVGLDGSVCCEEDGITCEYKLKFCI